MWSKIIILTLVFLCLINPNALVVADNIAQSPWNEILFIPTITYLLAAACGLTGLGFFFGWGPLVRRIFGATFSALKVAALVLFFILCIAQPRSDLSSHDGPYIICIVVA